MKVSIFLFFLLNISFMSQAQERAEAVVKLSHDVVEYLEENANTLSVRELSQVKDALINILANNLGPKAKLFCASRGRKLISLVDGWTTTV